MRFKILNLIISSESFFAIWGNIYRFQGLRGRNPFRGHYSACHIILKVSGYSSQNLFLPHASRAWLAILGWSRLRLWVECKLAPHVTHFSEVSGCLGHVLLMVTAKPKRSRLTTRARFRLFRSDAFISHWSKQVLSVGWPMYVKRERMNIGSNNRT